MSNPDIRRYERELRSKVQGLRRKKRVQEAFRHSLLLLLEEIPAPTYSDLDVAFGPPDQMAKELVATIPNLPKPVSLRQKIGILFTFCVVIVAICFGIHYCLNRPESGTLILANGYYTKERIEAEFMFRLDAPFNSHDYTWDQRGNEYLILVDNTNQIETIIYITYSKYQPPHTLIIPAGEQHVFQVKDACFTEHTVSFETSDGSMNGRIQVLIPKDK